MHYGVHGERSMLISRAGAQLAFRTSTALACLVLAACAGTTSELSAQARTLPGSDPLTPVDSAV